MNFLRKSLFIKSFLFFAFLMAIFSQITVFLFDRGRESLSIMTVLLTVSVLMIVILAVFLWRIYAPINRVTSQVNSLLTGKSFRRIPVESIDEIGVMTHFFNQITEDLEKISYDLKERKRMSSELDIASDIQRDVLPKEAPEVSGLDIVAKTRSAAEVGGDTFDFMDSSDLSQFFIYIGDVTGHGVPAGLIMMMVETLMTAMIYTGVNNGKDLVAHTNKLLTPRINARLFMTSVVLRWDKHEQKMYYTGAGHEHLLVYHHASQMVESIPSGGIALGMVPEISKIVQEKYIPLEIGDAIVLYSDGVTEAKNHIGEMYGMESLAKSVQRHAYRPSAESILDNLTKDFSDFVGEYVQVDDITMIIIKYVGKDIAPSKIKLTIAKEKSKEAPRNKKWNWVD